MFVFLARIFPRVLVIVALAATVAYAGFVRGETPGATFATNGINLKIDSAGFYNGKLIPKLTWALKDLVPYADKFFNFNDIKPGDFGATVISFHPKNTSAWICMDFKNLKSSENGVNEPESLVEPNGNASGELAKGLEFFGWMDSNSDHNFDVGERALFGTSSQSAVNVLNNKTYALADDSTGAPWSPFGTKYVGVYWCAGDLQVNLGNANIMCNGGVLGNEAQTDSMTVDVKLRAYSAKENPKFLCNPGAQMQYASSQYSKNEEQKLKDQKIKEEKEKKEREEREKNRSHRSGIKKQ